MNDHTVQAPPSSMDDEVGFDAAVFDTAVNHCIEKLDTLVMRLHRYPLDAVTVAMGTYLQELLGFLLEERACTVDDALEFLRDIEAGIRQSIPPTEK